MASLSSPSGSPRASIGGGTVGGDTLASLSASSAAAAALPPSSATDRTFEPSPREPQNSDRTETERSAANTQRGQDEQDRADLSAANTRPSSADVVGQRSSRPIGSARPAHVEEEHGAASEASKAAAAEAQASVLKESGGGLPGAPAGLLSYAGLSNPMLAGLGAAPVMAEVPLVTVPRLDDLLVKALADNYHVVPAFDWIPAEYLDNVVALLQPGKLDFASSAALVHAEKYWTRLCCERWDRGSINLAEHGNSWKRLYCERHLKECLEKYHHSKQQHNYKRLLKEVEACKPFVHTLHLSELMSHIDLSDLLFDFPTLCTLDLKFGARELGMDYSKSLFGMNLGDSQSLSRLLASTATISRLTLSENLLNDEGVLVLMQGLHPSVNRTLTFLDLSHNKIGDIGAKRLAELIDGGLSRQADQAGAVVGSVLQELILEDNSIRRAGAEAFGAALQFNRGLRKLNLSLNPLDDQGGVGLLSGLTQHTSLRTLEVSGTDLAAESGDALLNLLRFNRSLESLNLSCNELHGANGGASLLDALRQNEQIVSLDTRRNGVNAKVELEMKTLLAKRMALQKQQSRKAFQKDWDAAI